MPVDFLTEEQKRRYGRFQCEPSQVQLSRFLPTFLKTVQFQATSSGQPILDALQFLAGIEGRTEYQRRT